MNFIDLFLKCYREEKLNAFLITKGLFYTTVKLVGPVVGLDKTSRRAGVMSRHEEENCWRNVSATSIRGGHTSRRKLLLLEDASLPSRYMEDTRHNMAYCCLNS